MACEKPLEEAIGTTPSLAAPTDWVFFRTADGTWLIRQWANWVQTTPEDVELDVIAFGGDIDAGTVDNGTTEVTIPGHIGWRTRLYRNGAPQRKNTADQTYFAYDITTGNYILTPALNTGETLIFQAY